MPDPSKTLQEALPDPSEGMPEDDADLSAESGFDLQDEVDALPNLVVGRERLEFLRESSAIYYAKSARRYTIRGAHVGYDHDFVDQSNFEWFKENCPWLSFNDEVYIDEDDAVLEARRLHSAEAVAFEDDEDNLFLLWLQKIEDDAWEVFKDAVEGMENYPVLDEDRMSQLEMEALDEWIADEGVDELKKALKKLPAFANSLIQFAITQLTLRKTYELSREEEWHRENTSVWINMERVAANIDDADELFTDGDGNNIRPRLERNFMRYKRYAWKAHLAEPFRAAIAKHAGEDMQTVNMLQRLTDDQLFAFLLHLTPDDAYGTDEPAWYEASITFRTDRGEEDTKYKAHDYWTVQLDEDGKWEEAIDVLGMVGAEKLYAFFAGRAADDPRQLKLPGFESRKARPANLREDGDDTDADDEVYTYLEGGLANIIARGPNFVISEVAAVNDIVAAFGELKRPILDEEGLNYYTRDRELFMVRFSNNESMLLEEDLRHPSISIMRMTDGLDSEELKDYPEVVQALIGYYGTLIDSETDRAANMLLKLGGPDAVRPHEDKLDPGMLGGYAIRAGIFYATNGDMRKAVKMLKNRGIIPVRNGAWIHFGDWEDTAPLFADTRNYNWEKNAEKLFSGEAYDWFDGVYSMTFDHTDAYRYLLPKHWNMLREVLVGRSYTNDNGEEMILTPAIIRDWRDRDVEKAIDSREENPDMQEIVTALERVCAELERRAQEDATYEGFRECAREALEATEWRYFNVRGVNNRRRDSLAFFVPYSVLEQRLQKYYDDNDEYFDGTFTDLMIATSEKAVPNEDYTGRVTKETGPDLIDDILGELEPVDIPEDPRQGQLALESAGQPSVEESAEARVQRLVEDTYDRGCLMVHLPKEQADFIQDWGRLHISDDKLYVEGDGYGRETETHITVKWGILLPEPNDKLKEIANTTKPFPVRIGRVSLFNTNPNYDVVKLDILSPGLRVMNARVRGSVPNEETYPSYRPHCTVAYVKKGTCDNLAGQPVFGVEGSPNSTFFVYDLTYKGPGEDGDKKREHKLYLQGGRVQEAAQPDPFEKLPFPADPSRLRKRKGRKARSRSVCS